MQDNESSHVTFRCTVLGLGHAAHYSNWILAGGYALLLVALGPFMGEISTGANSSMTIHPRGWLTIGLLFTPAIAWVSRRSYDAEIGPEGVRFDLRGGPPLHEFLPYSAVRSVARDNNQIVLTRPGGGGVVRLKPSRLAIEDLVDVIQERLAERHPTPLPESFPNRGAT